MCGGEGQGRWGVGLVSTLFFFLNHAVSPDRLFGCGIRRFFWFEVELAEQQGRERGDPSKSEITVCEVECYNAINAYLSELSNTPIKTFEDIIRFNNDNTGTEGGIPNTHRAWPSGQVNPPLSPVTHPSNLTHPLTYTFSLPLPPSHSSIASQNEIHTLNQLGNPGRLRVHRGKKGTERLDILRRTGTHATADAGERHRCRAQVHNPGWNNCPAGRPIILRCQGCRSADCGAGWYVQ